MKKALLGAFGVLAIGLVALPFHSADAQVRPSPTPILKVAPQFSCSAMVNGTSGTAVIQKTNAVAVDKTKDVVAVIKTPSGNVSTALCGASFASTDKANSPFTIAPTTDKTWIYTCSAQQTQTTSACNPPK